MTSSSAQQWANDDLATLDLGDERRNRRARQMVERIAQRPGALITAVFEGKAQTDAAYRLLNNPAVAPDEIRAALQRGTVERLAEIEVVLAPQDTTCLDFSGHPATEGLGPHRGPQRKRPRHVRALGNRRERRRRPSRATVSAGLGA